MQEDGLKWFGEGFDGFPKILPDDCIEYTIYVIDTKLSDFEKREQLRKVQNASITLTQDLTKGFIWQREPFNLTLERHGKESSLKGCTNFGDSVEDEWLVAYILREISFQYSQVWIRMVDSDGQFLLVEAAGVLPKWLNPEIADFRVWLNSGKLLLIPLDDSQSNAVSASSKHKASTLEEALNFIGSRPSDLVHLPKIQAEAFARLQHYPQQIMNSLHHALVAIPRKLAYILHENPSYIGSAVEAFYLRDPISLRPLQSVDKGKLMFPPKDLVTVSAKFTKVGYAQLKSQPFDPPVAWASLQNPQHSVKSRKPTDLGMKVTCSFEMLMADPQNQDKKVVREIKLLLDDLDEEEGILPSDADVAQWSRREDDEDWLDINFDDFEKELRGSGQLGPNQGFGDKNAQERLRKMVGRFEDFLNDETAGADGAENLEDMDEDDESDEENGTLSDGSIDSNEDKEISFDEVEFANMMSTLTGVSRGASSSTPPALIKADVSVSESINDSSNNESLDENLQREMHAIEHELREAGALDLNSSRFHELAGIDQDFMDTRSSRNHQANDATVTEKGQEPEGVDIDYNLAKNILESMKSQGGASGPSSNLLGLMGLQLPRDENGQD